MEQEAPSELPLTAVEVRRLESLLACVLPSSSGPGATEARAIDYVVRRLPAENGELVATLRRELVRDQDPSDLLAQWSVNRDGPMWPLFRFVRSLAWQGYLCDPVHGGNALGVGWQRFGVAGPPQPDGFSASDLLGSS